MDYENIDWELEAKRVARAFGLTEKAEFRRKTKTASEQHILLRGNRNYLVVHESLHLSVIYKPHAFWFKLQNEETATWITVDPAGQPLQWGEVFEYAQPLAKGLFHLGFLTPQVEDALRLCITDRQKAEWTSQYESWGFTTMDWDAEAKRVARAFRLSEPCTFVEPKGKRYRELHGENGTSGCPLPEAPDLVFRCTYSMENGLTYSISRSDYYISTDINLEWNGQAGYEIYDDDYSEMMARGLFHLGLFTASVEAALRLSITAHQKMEWALEYEARYGL